MPILALIIVVILVGMVLSSAWGGVIMLTIVAVTAVLGVMFFVAAFIMNNAMERSLMIFMGIIFLIPLAYKSYHWLQDSEEAPQTSSYAPVERELSDDEVFSVSAHILALGKKTGCGSFDVTSRDRIGKFIEVKCYDGRSWRLENGAMLKINGSVVGY